jgi:hypothetical protein
VGAAGLSPTLAAIRAGSNIALANKECLVSAGELFVAEAHAAGVEILPVDSEHNAIFQALGSNRIEDVDRIILTASGGPFRDWSKQALIGARPEEALKHPNWSMGPKISIDSATLMNKGLELIEAYHLFGVEPSRIEVVVHPQSIVHGLVAYRDGTMIAALSAPDMRMPIAHCLAWPSRARETTLGLDLTRISRLTFERPDTDRFPALRVAREALAAGGWRPTAPPPTRSPSRPSRGRSASRNRPDWWRIRCPRRGKLARQHPENFKEVLEAGQGGPAPRPLEASSATPARRTGRDKDGLDDGTARFVGDIGLSLGFTIIASCSS